VIAVSLAEALEGAAAGPVLAEPLPGERAALNLFQDAPHLGAGFLRDDARAPGVVPVFGRVADGVAHELQAAPVHQVDDQLELVETLEVGHLRPIPRLGEGLESGLHQRGDAAAEDRLLAEQISLGFLTERGLDHSGPGTPDA
jgi:hypothetical protein